MGPAATPFSLSLPVTRGPHPTLLPPLATTRAQSAARLHPRLGRAARPRPQRLVFPNTQNRRQPFLFLSPLPLPHSLVSINGETPAINGAATPSSPLAPSHLPPPLYKSRMSPSLPCRACPLPLNPSLTHLMSHPSFRDPDVK
jgi:hypothetical protein